MEQPTVPLEWHEKTCAFLALVQEANRLLCALDDVDLPERPALLARRIVRLSYLQGQTSVQIPRQEDLCELAGIAKTKAADALYQLVDAKILLVHPESKVYEILPNVAEWKVRPRCRFGQAHADELAAEIAREDLRRRSEQRDLGELDQSFVPEPTLRQIIGQNAREEAGTCPELPLGQSPTRESVSLQGRSSVKKDMASSRSGADESKQANHPPEPIGTEKPAGVLNPFERLRQVVEEKGEVTQEVTFLPPGAKAASKKVTFKVTPAPESPPGDAKSYLKGNSPSRACVRSSYPSESSGKSELQLSSEDHPDEGRADERRGAGGSQMEESLAAELFGDIQRKFGGLSYANASFWRDAIAACHPAAAYALEVIKCAPRNHPGGYMRTAFYNECDRRGIKLPDLLEHRRPQTRHKLERGCR